MGLSPGPSSSPSLSFPFPFPLVRLFLFLVLLSPLPLRAAPSDVPPSPRALAISRDPLTAQAIRLELAAAHLVRGEIDTVQRLLDSLPPSPRRDYLLRQLAAAYGALDEKGIRQEPSSPMARATGSHNLFLFLRGAGLPAPLALPLAERAIESYRRMFERDGTDGKDRAFARGACAALLHEVERRGEARLLRKDFDPLLVPEDDRNLLLAYMAVTFGDRERALSLIRASLARNHRATVFWLLLSDDFYRLAGDEAFRSLMGRALREEARRETEGAR